MYIWFIFTYTNLDEPRNIIKSCTLDDIKIYRCHFLECNVHSLGLSNK